MRSAPMLMLAAVLVWGCNSPSKDRPAPEKRAVVQDTGSKPARDSIVLLIIDTLRADVMGAYGFPFETSPELDALAREGVIFERPVAQCSWTRPSIGSMLTGVYPRELGLYKEEGEALPPQRVTLAEALEAAGYTTIGVTANPNINSVFRFDQGFDYYGDSTLVFPFMPFDDKRNLVRPGHLMTANQVFATALDQLGKAGGPPYFIQLNIMEIHPLGAPTRNEFKNLFPDVYPDRKRKYVQALRQVSRDFAAFLDELRSRPGMESTLLVVTSDHGQGLGAHGAIPGGVSHGSLLYESQVIVPLVFWHSRGKLGKRSVGRPVRVMDIMPTVLELNDVAAPPGMNGVSLVPLLTGNGPDPVLPERFVVETHFRDADKSGVYGAKWKFFDNRDDWDDLNRKELQPVGGSERGAATDKIGELPDVAGELEAYLSAWDKDHRPVATTPQRRRMTPAAIKQLKALGYLED